MYERLFETVMRQLSKGYWRLEDLTRDDQLDWTEAYSAYLEFLRRVLTISAITLKIAESAGYTGDDPIWAVEGNVDNEGGKND